MAMTLITTNPDSTDVANVSFTSSIDSTYKLYIFKFINVNPATDEAEFQVNFSTDGGSNYNMTKTTTQFKARHGEDDSTFFGYQAAQDLAQSTSYQNLTDYSGNAADESINGTLWLFNPSNTTYVKHFYATLSANDAGSGTAQSADNFFVSGYINSTSDIDAVDFKMDSGNMDGVIKMYGVG